MFNQLKEKVLLYIGKSVIFTLNIFNKSGTALPGQTVLKMDSGFLRYINKRCDKIILITGTNGKTTTNNLLNHVLKDNILLSNLKGANMIQGIATTYIRNTKNHYDYGIFEVDEGSLDKVSRYLDADYIIITNFFRDQLDRYGEIEGIINEVYEDIKQLPDAKLIINCDDPNVYKFKQLPNEIIPFGLDIESRDVIETNLTINKCPNCGEEIKYDKHTYGHLGNYFCKSCGFANNEKKYIITNINESNNDQKITISHDNETEELVYPYTGIYNAYNVLGVYSLAKELNIDNKTLKKNIENFSFTLGRMEEFTYKNKKIKVILTKNPIGLSQATQIISKDTRTKSILHILNDNPADGRDISWIWDANTNCTNDDTINKYFCSGIRAEEIALKKKYDDVNVEKINIINNRNEAIDTIMEENVDIVYILPTYTAIFETRDYISKKVGG